MNSIINDIKYNDSGLVPTIVQDYNSGDILMFAFSNEEAIRKSITTNIAHFWSRSRKELWEKGSTSGNRLNIVNIYISAKKIKFLSILLINLLKNLSIYIKLISDFSIFLKEKKKY